MTPPCPPEPPLLRRRGPAAAAPPIAPPALLAVLFAAVLCAPRPARAHEFRPGSLDVTSAGGGRYEVEWDPPSGPTKSQPVFPPSCTRTPPAPADSPLPALSAPGNHRFWLDCPPPGLRGSALTITGLAPLRDEVLVRLHLEDGAELTAMLTAAHPTLEIPPAAAPLSASSTVASYAWAGAEHLLTGLDHILFLLGLLFLVRGLPLPGTAAAQPGEPPTRPAGHSAAKAPLRAAPWVAPLVRAVTAFTLAHSLTLALQVLGAVHLPPPPVEAAIALSVLFLAREILRPPARPTLVHRRPWLAAFGFGLLHGLGFAGGLAAHGLPPSRVPAALLGFNLGLEAAQLALVLAALLLARALRPLAARLPSRLLSPPGPRLASRAAARGGAAGAPLPAPGAPLPAPGARPPWTRALPAYALGAVAAFWLLARIAAFRP